MKGHWKVELYVCQYEKPYRTKFGFAASAVDAASAAAVEGGVGADVAVDVVSADLAFVVEK